MAQDLALQAASELGADVLLLSEVYRPPANNGRWVLDSSKSVAVVATSGQPIQRVWSSAEPGLVAAQVAGIVFISCYAPPRLTIAEYERFLEAVELETMSHSNVVVAGDFNAWHTEWGSRRNNTRGEELLDFTQTRGLQMLNHGSTPTFGVYDTLS